MKYLPSSCFGEQTFPTEQHHQDQDRSQNQERVGREVDRRAKLPVEPEAELRKTSGVEPRKSEGANNDAPDVTHSTEHDHRQEQDRNRERESIREYRVRVDCVHDATHSTHERTHSVGGELGPHEWHTHHAGREFILTNGQPGSTEASFADSQGDEDRERSHNRKQQELRTGIEGTEWL